MKLEALETASLIDINTQQPLQLHLTHQPLQPQFLKEHPNPDGLNIPIHQND